MESVTANEFRVKRTDRNEETDKRVTDKRKLENRQNQETSTSDEQAREMKLKRRQILLPIYTNNYKQLNTHAHAQGTCNKQIKHGQAEAKDKQHKVGIASQFQHDL